MFFQPVKTPGIAHVAYILAENGVAALVDPGRDVERYLQVIEANGLRLRWIIETHRQEDFEMGGATLRHLTGAEIVACDHEITGHADRPMRDGEDLDLTDGLTIKALHTPGHTPESVSYAVTIAAAPENAWGVFTGDTLFIGDTGRTDLTDESKTGEHAGLVHDMVHQKILPLGDQAFVLPAHGAGSACGGNVADRDHSTLGLERVSNAVAVKSRSEFIRHKLAEKLARPPYFRLMEKVNLEAGRPFENGPVRWLKPEEFRSESESGIIIDARDPEAYAGGHVPNSYSVWLGGMSRYGGWIAGTETPIYLVVDGPAALEEARLSLARIGLDNIAGALTGGFDDWRKSGMPVSMSGTVSARQVHDRFDEFVVVDVREEGEFLGEGHIPGARHMFVGHLEENLDRLRLDRERPVAVTCSVGHRGSLGASILKRHGFENAFNLLGGMTAWKALDFPLEEEPPSKEAAS